LLGCHVGHSSDDLVLSAVAKRSPQFGRHSEVEDDDATLGRHAHVRRLEIAVQLAHVVQGSNAFDELTERRAKLLEVGG